VYADSVAEVRPDAFDALIASESASLPSCTIDECFPFVLAQRRKRIGVSQDIKLGIGMNLFRGLYRCLFPTQLLITSLRSNGVVIDVSVIYRKGSRLQCLCVGNARW